MSKRLAISVLLIAISSLAQQPPSSVADLASHVQTTGADPIGKPFYHFAYYLFLAQAPHGCEACYIPLLITAEPLEKAVQSKERTEGVWIITYERDSIWQFDGVVDLKSEDIEAPARKIHVKGREYRYQEVLSEEVVKLLQHPLGTIPISRPFLVNVVPPGASLEELTADFQTIFRVRERKAGPVVTEHDQEAKQSSFTSLLTVLDDGKFDFRIAEGCFDRSSWNCPIAETQESFPYEIQRAEIYELRALLDRKEVQQVSDFMNAAPISNDFEIQIPRADGVQNIEVLAWMPDHFEIRERPALLYLICKAQEIEQHASSGREIPKWCQSLSPLK